MKSIVRNPRRKVKRKKKRKLSPLQKLYFGKRKTLRRKKRNPAIVARKPKRRVKKRRTLKTNPTRSKHVMKKRRHRRKHHIKKYAHRRRKRNPSGKFDFVGVLKDGLFGIAGGVANNVAAKLVSKFVPGTASPMTLNILRVVSAVGVTYLASRFLSRDQARAVGIGAIVGVGLPIAQQAFPLAGDESADRILANMGLKGVLDGADVSTSALSASHDFYGTGEDLAAYDIDGFDDL